MSRKFFPVLFAALVTFLLVSQIGCSSSATGKPTSGDPSPKELELLNVSYDPTRELWKDINAEFIPVYEKQAGVKLTIKQSHGGSASQARAVADGLEADVVTLAIWNDIDAIRKAGLIDDAWEQQFSNKSLPYRSTIVFVVRKGNPKGVKDWSDLVRGDIQIITPSPKTSGNGKLSFLAAWGAIVLKGGSEAEAQKFVSELYQRVPVLDTGARGATTTFAQKGIGDVHLTWENEAALEVAEAKGELEVVYPSISIQAEPPVAVVTANAKKKGTLKASQAYLKFLYSDAGQAIIAKHHYRPTVASVGKFPEIQLFEISKIAKSWEDAQKRFFADGAVFDQIYVKK